MEITIVTSTSFMDARRLYRKFVRIMQDLEPQFIKIPYEASYGVDLDNGQRIIFVNEQIQDFIPIKGTVVNGRELEKTLNLMRR